MARIEQMNYNDLERMNKRELLEHILFLENTLYEIRKEVKDQLNEKIIFNISNKTNKKN